MKNCSKQKNTDPKVLFRRSKQWSAFRNNLKKKQKTDPITGSPLSRTCNCHHLDLNSKHYSDISDESHFICLNSTSHTVIHFLFGDGSRRYDWRKRLKRIEEICEVMEQINNKE